MSYKHKYYRGFLTNEKTKRIYNFAISLEYTENPNGFCHYATIYDGEGHETQRVRCRYYNRTWERFTFESVINRAMSTWLERHKKATDDFTLEIKEAYENKASWSLDYSLLDY